MKKITLDKTTLRRDAVIAIDKATLVAGKASNLLMRVPIAGKVTQKLLETISDKVIQKSQDGKSLSPLLELLRHARRTSSPPQGRTLEGLRQSYADDMHSFRRFYDVGHVEDLHIPLSATGIDIPARFYTPKMDKQNLVLPVLLVYFHGGGFVMGDLDTHDDACRLLCQHAGMPVLSVDYRLAPEFPYPTAVNDTAETLAWILAHKARFGVEYIAIGGDSAGANLATVTAQSIASSLSTQNKPLSAHSPTNLLAQLLIYPPTDATQETESTKIYDDGYFLDRVDRDIYYTGYLGSNEGVKSDIQVSPLLNKSVTNLASALVVTAGFDILCDEGKAYAVHLKSNGIRTETLHYGRLPHAFVNFASIHEESRQAMLEIAHTWRKLCIDAIAAL